MHGPSLCFELFPFLGKGCVGYRAGEFHMNEECLCHLASFSVKSQETGGCVRGLPSFLTFILFISQKLAITPVSSVASSTSTTLPTKSTWLCMLPSVSICCRAGPVQAGTSRGCGQPRAGRRDFTRGDPSTGAPAGHGSCADQGTVKLSWDPLSQGHC